MLRIKSFLLLVCFFISLGYTHAAHIVGGQLVYACKDGDISDGNVDFSFECTVYRDQFSDGAVFDPNINFGVYRFNGVDWIHVRTQEVILDVMDIEVIPFDDTDPCVEIPPRVGVEKAIYKFDLKLDVIDQTYMIAYQRCCRNNTITNIQDPGETGAVIHVAISPLAQQSCNSTPTFENFPPIFICQDQELFVNQSAVDIDGDQLRYSFCAPLSAGGQDGSTPGTAALATSCTGVTPSPENCVPPFADVVFNLPYAFDYPLDSLVVIDNMTGLISGVPQMVGQYVVGICVEEYRGGVLVGQIVRDFQFNVVECNPTVLVSIESDSLSGPKSFVFNLCGETEMEFVNQSIREDKIVSYEWIMDMNNGTFDTVITRDAFYAFPDLGTYEGTLILNKGTECADTAEITVNVYPETIADYSFAFDSCIAGPITFNNLSTTLSNSIDSYYWDFGEGTSTDINPSFEFLTPGIKNVLLSIEDENGCIETIEKDVRYFPVPETLIAVPSNFVGCTPANVTFDNLSIPIDTTYTTIWDFGDGTTGDELSPSHLYENEGVYTVQLDVVSPIGCTADRTFPNLITIKASPVADFDCTPEEFNSIDNEIFLFDMSTDADRLQWIIPGVGVSTESNPTFALPDTGIYEINLVAVHLSGCPDTLTKLIDVKPLDNLYFPNAFTPNNDGKNDDFKGVGLVEGLSDYQLVVWNRWGESIFTTNDVYTGWNGQDNNVGQQSPTGTYIYTYSYSSGRGEKQEGQGKIILLR